MPSIHSHSSASTSLARPPRNQTQIHRRYLAQTAGLWGLVACWVSGAIVGVMLTVDKHAPGYLLLVGALLLPSVVSAFAMKDVAATITMDDVGFSAITAGLRRRSGDWSEVTAEHTEAWGGRYGPYVSLRHNIVKSKVGLRKTTGSYDDAMRFAIAHSANRIPFEAALKQRQARRRART